MRVFLDTNVLASATAARGLCADVLREVLASHSLVSSDAVFAELARVLREDFGMPPELVSHVLQFLRYGAVIAHPTGHPPARLKDKDDLPILSAAIAGSADAFVTGDKEILALERVGALRILSPRQFLLAHAAPGRRTKNP